MNTPDIAIRLTDVGKAYYLYDRPSDRLREVLFRKLLRKEHWALQGVNVEIPRGETFGLVGENGAGKSTFLKLVAGTVAASHGKVAVAGRTAALLELGAGFHPEETGLDNVRMMGTLNGVTSADMAAYCAEVAEFSELPAEVLTRPVKTYSSGMFMRLAFAAATAVEPDVLVIDEALSVGDMHFQKKSLDRIMQFREAGKTVLFCSHNLYQVRSLCSRAAWIRAGQVVELGDTEHVVTAYEAYEREKEGRFAARDATPLAASVSTPSAGSAIPVRITGFDIETPDGVNPAFVETYQPVRLIFEIDAASDRVPFHVGFAITRNDKENVFGSSSHFVRTEPYRGPGRLQVVVNFPSFPLLSGDYLLSVYALDDTGIQVLDMAEGVRPFRVIHKGREFGLVHLPHHWEV